MHYRYSLAAAALLLLALAPGPAAGRGPEGKAFGLGLALGEPMGVSAKYWLNQRNALDMAVGWGYYPHSGGAVFVDYLYHAFNFGRPGPGTMDILFFLGIGGKLGVWHYHHTVNHLVDTYNEVGLGIRIPFGINLVFRRVPFDIYFEIAPALAFIAPDPFWFDFDGCVGGRFYF